MAVLETGRHGIIIVGGSATMYVSEKVADPLKGGVTDRLCWRVHSQCPAKLKEGQGVTLSPDGTRAYTEDGEKIIPG